MQPFTQLLLALEQTSSSEHRVRLMQRYFANAPESEAVWALHLLLAAQRKRIASHALLRELAIETTGTPEWLFEASLAQTGDQMETVALLVGRVNRNENAAHALGEVPDDTNAEVSLETVMGEWLPALRDAGAEERVKQIVSAWKRLTREQSLVWNKLLTGTLHAAVERREIAEALAELHGLPQALVAQRLTQLYVPSLANYRSLFANEANALREYPFALAGDLQSLSDLGEHDAWHFEPFFTGLRVQVIRRPKDVVIWSRTGDALTDKFPEIAQAARELPPDTVIDGNIVSLAAGGHSIVESRARRVPSRKVLSEQPVVMVCFDVLELKRTDLRTLPLTLRREALENTIASLLPGSSLVLADALEPNSWSEAESLRSISREGARAGLVLKRRSSGYPAMSESSVGRSMDWLKWHPEPQEIDAVLMYAERSATSAELQTYSFGLWHRDELVPIAKVPISIGLDEKRELDQWIMANTLERFGPVRTVPPQQVFGIGFLRIEESSRHKSGLVLREAKAIEWKREKPAASAMRVEDARKLLR